MDVTSLTTLMTSGKNPPEFSDITPSYVNKTRQVSYCIQMTLELVVLFYLICSQKCRIKVVYALMAMMMISSSIMLVVLFVPGLNLDMDNIGFYLVQTSRLFDLLSTWTYVYYLLRVSLLMPTYLNFKKLHLYKH